MSRKQFSDFVVVSDSEKSENKYKFTKNIKNKPKIIGVCAHFWKILISTQRPWNHQELKSLHIKNQLNVPHGANME